MADPLKFEHPIDALRWAAKEISDHFGYNGIDEEAFDELERYMNEPVEYSPDLPLTTDY